MSRLRVRIELNRRMSGVPLDKMASVVEETRKFFCLLSEDVHIEADGGEWLASDFDAESLNFTAEYGTPVSSEQAQAFGAAFSGATSLRRATIAQFTRIADFLGEDELVGFGFYQSDEEAEPTEWRCLSKRDAMRFGDEIKLLAEAAGEQLPLPQTQPAGIVPHGLPHGLPQVMNGSLAGRRLFKDRREEMRRERAALASDPSKLLRELESNLSRRIGLLEDAVAEQARKMQQIRGHPGDAEEKFQKLLSAMETFWAQAPRQLPLLAAPAPASAQAAASMPVPVPEIPPVQAEAKIPDAPVAPIRPAISTPQERRGWSILGVSAAAAAAILAGLAFPQIQHQWARFVFVESLPVVKLKTPAAPALPAIPAPLRAEAHAEVQRAIKTVAARSREPFVGPQIPLDIPARLKPKIQSDVQVDVVVAIDEEGNVTGARVASTKGERAQLLVTEALRAAKNSHFRPAREGAKTVESQMILSFQFKPELNAF
jgi:hypothetical protein